MPSLIRRRGWEPAHFPWFTALVAGGLLAAFLLDDRWSTSTRAGERVAPFTAMQAPGSIHGDTGSSAAGEAPGSEADAFPTRPVGTTSLPGTAPSGPDPEPALTVGVR